MYLCKLEQKEVLQSELIDFIPTNAKRVVILDSKNSKQRKTIEKIFNTDKKKPAKKSKSKKQKEKPLVENVQNQRKSKQKQPAKSKNKSKETDLLSLLKF